MQTYDLQITIGSITLNDFTDRTKFYKVDNTRELLSTLTADRTEMSRQGDHGTTDSLSRYGSRTLPFSGEIVAPTIAERVQMERALQKVIALAALQDYATNDGYVLVKFKLEDGTLIQCYAKVLQPPLFSFRDEYARRHQITRFSFALVAKDPRLYGQDLLETAGEETFEGTTFGVIQGVAPTVPFSLIQNTVVSAECENEGTFDAPPVITVTGPTTSPKVMNVTTGKYIELTGLTLADGDTVEINVGKRTIKLANGTDASAYFGNGSSWLVLVPGVNDLTLLDGSPSLLQATFMIQWRNTYI